MPNSQSSYRQILKATSIFGGVQVFQIIIQIIRTKFVAVLLGSAGMGIVGLLTSTTGFITAITSFGITTSGVKSIAEAEGSGNDQRIATIVIVLRKCVWITGILGLIVTIILSPWLSQITFGNSDYTFAFIWLSITFIINQLSVGQLVILQGLRKYKYLANANLTGSIFGLFASIPIYYLFGIKGIVPVIIITSLANLIRSWYFARKIKIVKVHVDKIVTIKEAKSMLKLGFVISLSGIASLGASYLIRIFITQIGDLSQVGLYSAGYTLLNTYFGMIFTAMGKDYFPRLSYNSDDNDYCLKSVNEQAEISFLLLTPILVVFLVFTPLIIHILFTVDFLQIDKMLYWSTLGVLFRAASWSLSYLFVAKGNSKVFFYNELFASLYFLLLNMLGYFLFGLTGVGVSFLISYILYLIHMSILSHKLYKISLRIEVLKIFAIQLFLCISVFATAIYFDNNLRYYVGIPISIICIIYSYKKIDQRIQISKLLTSILNKKRKSE